MSHWDDIALPILEVLVSRQDALRDDILEVGLGDRGTTSLGLNLPEGELFETLFCLRDLGYVEFSEPMYEGGGGALFTDLRVSGRGLQVLGEWPRFEAMISPTTLAAALERLADYAGNEDDRTNLKRAADYVRQRGVGALRGLILTAGSVYVRQQLGLP